MSVGIPKCFEQVSEKINSISPTIGTALKNIYGWYIRRYVHIITWYEERPYSAPLEPYRLLWVDPCSVDLDSNPQFWFQPYSSVESGNWDRSLEHFEDHTLYRSFIAHFRHGVPWEDTEHYDRILDQIRRGDANPNRYGTTEKDVQARFQKLDELYNYMNNNGFLTQKELRNKSNKPLEPPREHLPPELFEIAICIGRNGELIFDDGRHRLSIAKLLDIDEIPVRVIARHEKWQQIRDHVYKEGQIIPTDVQKSHPDIEYLFN